MERYGCELKFITRINSDGLTVETVNDAYVEHAQDHRFELFPLSVSEGTFIAQHMGTFVVKLKNAPN